MEKAKGIVWDLKDLYGEDRKADIENDIGTALKSAQGFKNDYYEKIAAEDCTAERLLASLKSYEALIEKIYRPYATASLLFSGDGRSDEYKALIAKVQDAMTRITNDTLFFTLEIQKIPQEKISEFYTTGQLGHYRWCDL